MADEPNTTTAGFDTNAIFNGLLDIGKTAVGNLTNRNATAPATTVSPTPSPATDYTKYMIIGAVLLGLVLVGKMLSKD